MSSAIAFCKPRLGGEEPALGDERGERLARVLGVERGRAVLVAAPPRARRARGPKGRAPSSANTPTPSRPLRVAAHRAAAAREQVHLRVERRAGELDVGRSLLDARRGHLQVRVVRERFLHERVELRVVEGRKPPLADCAVGVALRGPSGRDLEVRAAPAARAPRAPGAISARSRRAQRRRRPTGSSEARASASVQLEDQVVQVRADAQDHLADDVHRVQVVGVDRGVARGAGGEEQLLVALGDVELDREPARAASP